MHNQYKLISSHLIPGTVITEKIYHIFHSGSCQCFKDCDCAKDKGKFLGETRKYRHPLSYKVFDDLKACGTSYNALVQNQLTT